MRSEDFAYEADVSMVGTVYYPERDRPAPVVIVFPDIFGVGEQCRDRAARLAQIGYVALAANLHGNGRTISVEEIPDQLQRFYDEPGITCSRGDAAVSHMSKLDAASS